MQLTFARKESLEDATVSFVEARGSYRESVTRAIGVIPRDYEIVAVAGGRKLVGRELDQPADPDADVLVLPNPKGPALIAGAFAEGFLLGLGAIALTVGGAFLLGHAVQKLFGPKPEQQDADDERSPTYGWGGIRTGVGQGFRVAKCYGLHRVGGNIIGSRVRTLPISTPAEVLDLVVLLSDGRCESVAGYTGGAAGEIDRIGEFLQRNPEWPTGILVNGSELQAGEAELSLRMGEFTQRPFAAMPSASTAVAVGGELNRVGHAASGTVPSAEASRIRVKVEFPSGLFKQDRGSGVISSYWVGYRVTWRESSSSVEHDLEEFTVQDLRRERFWIEREYTIPANDSYVVTVRRISDEGNTVTHVVVSDSKFATLTYEFEGVVANAGRCVMLLSLLANERQQEAADTVTILGKWRRLRVWDPVGGLSTPTWELPASGPHSGIWFHPPGRNPAWVFLDILLDRDGLNLLGEKAIPLKVDFAAIRDWADYCDETVDGEARFTFDGVFDAGDSIWDALARVCSVGLAVPVLRGDTISVVYEYRDAHGRGTNSVPARAPVTMLNSANVEQFEITYRDTVVRPNVIDVQILNAELDYEQDLVSVEDIEAAGLQAPYQLNAEAVRRATIQLFGCTSARRARLMAIYFHLLNRLVKSEVAFVCGTDQIGLEVKDIFNLQHDVFRPFDEESFGFRTSTDGNSATVTLDQDVTLDSGTGQTWIMVVDEDGLIQERQLTDPDGFYAAGTALNLSSAVDFVKGSPVTVGYQDQLVRPYVVTSITRMSGEGKDHLRKVHAVEWQPDAFEVPSGFSTLDDHGLASTQGLAPAAKLPAVEAVGLEPLLNGSTRIGFALPAGYRGRQARVSVSRFDGTELRSYGATMAEQIDVVGLQPHKDYIVRVAMQDRQGAFQATPAATEVYIARAPEFPSVSPGNVRGLASTVTRDGIKLSWHELIDGSLDYYEVRRGPRWIGAERLGRTKDTHFLVDAHATGQQTYHVRARHRAGCYSGESAALVVTPGVLPGTVSVGTPVTDLASGAAGSASGCAWDAGLAALVLNALTTEGSYTAAQLDAGSVATRFWSVTLDRYWVDVETLAEDLPFIVGDGESRWWQAEGREASDHLPGQDLWTTAAELTQLVGDLDWWSNGPPGTVGRHADIRIEARYDTTGSGGWSAWERFAPSWRTAQKIEVRLQLRRAHSRYSLRAQNLRIEAAA